MHQGKKKVRWKVYTAMWKNLLLFSSSFFLFINLRVFPLLFFTMQTKARKRKKNTRESVCIIKLQYPTQAFVNILMHAYVFTSDT